MRTTMQTLDQSLLNNLNAITTRMNTLTDQISSGSKMSTISDDPVNLVGALGLRTNLSQIQQYQSNLTYGNNMVGSAENALTQIKSLVMQAKTLATQAANSTLSQSDRTAMASQVQTLFQQVLTLSNTQVEGKYIFGGQKTTGYTQAEPTPFIAGQADQIQVNGNAPAAINNYLTGKLATDGTTTLKPGDLIINGQDVVSLYERQLQTSPNTYAHTFTVSNTASTDITSGQLFINDPSETGIGNIGSVDLTSKAPVNGLNMAGATNLKAAIDSKSTVNPPVQASLTTLYAGEAAQASGSSSTISFDLNGVTVTAKTNGSSPAQVAQDVVDAINAASDQTGVKAAVGDGNNGGVTNAVVLQNNIPGDETPITITNLSEPLGNTTGFTEGTYQAEDTNTGQITLLSEDGNGIDVSTDPPSNATLNLIGMDDGGTGTGAVTLPPSTIDLTQPDTNGLYMQSAYDLQQVLNNTTVQGKTGVTAKLTTLYAGGAVTTPAATDDGNTISFTVNNVPVNYTVDTTKDTDQATFAGNLAAAINAKSDQTGVTAAVGDGTNGGVANSLVLQNTMTGDDSEIVIGDITATDSGGNSIAYNPTGLTAGSYAPDATHNTGELAYSSPDAITLSSNNYSDGTILGELGLSGAGDGTLEYGTPLDAGQITINGIAIGASSPDGLSDVYADSSAAAKAAAINAQTAKTGVTAVVNPLSLSAQGGAVAGGVLSAGDLVINGVDIFGPGSGNLTTLYADTAASATLDTDPTSQISFNLNGYPVNVSVAPGSNAAQAAQSAVDAINQASGTTGVEALVGNGTNGGAVNAVVFRNTQFGDETPIEVTNYQVTSGPDVLGFGDFSTSSTSGSAAGTQAGTVSFDLNGVNVTVTTAGGSSSQVAQDTVSAINAVSGQTGVKAVVGDGTNGGPVNSVVFSHTQSGDDAPIEVMNYQVTSGSADLGFGDFSFEPEVGIVADQDQNNNLVNAINNLSDQTGINASRDASGTLLLTSKDGRNLHIQTSDQGEMVTHLNGGDPTEPQDKVYFGSIQLQSSQQFLLQTADGTDAALNNLGLGGGGFDTGDVAGDGTLLVHSATQQDGAVRYTGDRDGNLQVQVGATSQLAISQNGVNAILSTGVFAALSNFATVLQGQSFHQVTGSAQATDATAKLDSGNTGLTNADQVTAGSFSVTINDNSTSPPGQFSIAIPVDPSEDSLSDVAAKLNGLPGLQASVDDNGQLEISTTDSSRYSFTLGNDTSNFLSVAGLTSDDMQVNAADQSMQDFDNAMNSLANNVSDIAATANRITAQNGILSNLQTSTTEDLSQKQDTDMAQALMDLNSTQVAYQAALAAAAKTMQMSLVDFLK